MTETPTSGFVFNHTMLRVKDIARSLDFYTRVLGFSVIREAHFAQAKFSLYFLILDPEEAARAPSDPAERRSWLANLRGVLELTHNHGTEDDPAFAYHDGNSEPRALATSASPRPTSARPARASSAGRAVPEAAGRRRHEGDRLHQGPRRLLGRDHPADSPRPLTSIGVASPP